MINFTGQKNQYILIPQAVCGNKKIMTIEIVFSSDEKRYEDTFWYNPTMFGCCSTDIGGGEITIYIKGGYLCFFSGMSPSQDQYYENSGIYVSDGKIHRVALILDGSYIHAMHNHDEVYRFSIGRASANIPWCLGNGFNIATNSPSTSFNNYVQGCSFRLCRFTVYDKAIDTKDLYNFKSSEAICCYGSKLTDDKLSVKDLSGNNNNGTLSPGVKIII